MILDKIKAVINNKYLQPVTRLLMQGTSPRAIAFGIAGACVLGLFPVLGSTTLLCAAFALTFRLNLPLIQLTNFLLYPLQLILIIPFMKLGVIIFGFEQLNYTLNEMWGLITADMLHAISVLWYVTLQAIGVWLLAAPVIGGLIFVVILALLKRIHLGVR